MHDTFKVKDFFSTKWCKLTEFSRVPSCEPKINLVDLFQNQWQVNGGKCGICGDPWQGPRDHEAGGKYAGEVIVANYLQGQTIDVLVHLTSKYTQTS